MNEHRHLARREDQVGLSRQVFSMQPKPVAQAVQIAADKHLGLGVAAPYPAHDG
jgi:hypothetical protein